MNSIANELRALLDHAVIQHDGGQREVYCMSIADFNRLSALADKMDGARTSDQPDALALLDAAWQTAVDQARDVYAAPSQSQHWLQCIQWIEQRAKTLIERRLSNPGPTDRGLVVLHPNIANDAENDGGKIEGYP